MISVFDFDERYRKAKTDHLETQLITWKLQCISLDSVRRNHLLAAEASDDLETAQIHIEIANLTKQSIDQYRRLVNKYQPGFD